MIHETFFHTLKKSGEKAKITIRSKIIETQTYYFASVVGTEIGFYKNLSNNEKNSCLGKEITDGKFNTIFYRDKIKLKQDIIDFYDHIPLKSEV